MMKHRIGKKGAIAVCLVVMSLLSVGCGEGNKAVDDKPGTDSESGTTVCTTNDDARADSIAGSTEHKPESGINTDTTSVEKTVVMNEILSSNSKYMEHDGDFCDMIELANLSDEDIDLSDYCISDDLFNPMKAGLGGMIEKGGFAVFYCVGEGADIEKNELPFKISASGEPLVLTKDNGKVIETVQVPALEKNTAYARNSIDEFEVTGRPTFGSTNEFGSVPSILPEVSPADGTRAAGPVEINFTPCEGTEIFYTTDGSVPGKSSDRYDKPIKLTKTTTIRVFVRAESTQQDVVAAGTGKTDGDLTGFASYTFFIGEPDATLDDVCVAIGADSLSRLNDNPKSSTRYPVSVAMYRGGNKVFDEGCGMNATGNTSAVYDKKSYRLKFSKEFGESKLHYKVFDDLDIDSFDSLVLRGGSQDNEDIIMKDELVPLILRQGNVVSEVLTTHYRPVNLYINGEYRGLYYIREHIDGHMIASHYGCAHEDVTVVEQCREVKCGSAGKEWTDLWNYVDKNDLRDPEAFEYVSSRVSLESVADYYIIQIWLHNIDPDNVRVYKAGDDKWRYALYDLDLTLTDDGSKGSAFMLGRYNKGLYTFNALVYKLLQNDEFMELFLSRMKLLFTTILSEEKVLPIVDFFVGQIDHDMERSCGLWGPRDDSSKGVYYINYSTWKRRVESFKSRFAGRTALAASEFVRLKGVSDELVREYLSGIIK